MKRHMNRLLRAFRREDGVASLEFVLCLPVLLFIFMMSFESGMMMTRFVMLDRALDVTMREQRLGHYANPSANLLRTEICKHSIIIEDCNNVLRLNMTPVSKATFALPTSAQSCVNRAEAIKPPDEFSPNVPDEIMLIRVCVVVDALFPTTGLALRMRKDGQGGYWLVAKSAFVAEPA